MKTIVWMFVLFSLVGAYADIDVKSLKQVKQLNTGLRYLHAETNRHVSKRRLKRYYLAAEASKPLFSSIDDDVLELYMAAFLQNAHPYWLEDDLFVFHTSSNKRYLNQLKRLYKKRYNIKSVVYKNKKYRKGSFEIRSADYEDVKTYMDEHISLYFTRKNSKKKAKRKKQKHQKKAPKKVKHTEVVVAKIKRKKEANRVYHSFRYLDKYKEERSETLGKYILYTKADEPWFFGSMDSVYNLYLIAILNGAYPKWLEDERFVFHTSNNVQYLKRLKRVYKKRYHLQLSVARVSSRSVRIKAIESDDLKAYMLERMPQRYIKKSLHKKAAKVQRKKRAVNVDKKAAAKKARLKKARQKRLEQQRIAVAKAQKRVAEQKRKLRAKKEALAKKEREAKKREKEQKKARAVPKKTTHDRIHTLNYTAQAKLWQEKRRALERERQALEKEKKALAEAKKKLAAEKAARERLEKKRALEREKEAQEKRRIEKQQALEAEKKHREAQRRKAAKEKAMQKKLAQRRAAEKKAALLAKQKAEAKKKKEDALTSELDEMLEETSNYKKKLERSESIKYY